MQRTRMYRRGLIALLAVLALMGVATNAAAWGGPYSHYGGYGPYGHYGPYGPYGHYGHYGRYGHYGYGRYGHYGRYSHYSYSRYRYRRHYGYGYGAYAPGVVIAGGNEGLGAILGGIGGAVIGHQIGKGRGKTVATVAGGLIGVFAGSAVGRQLDERDRLQMARARQQALETARSGTQTPWRNPDTGRLGAVVPRTAFKNAQGQFCREFQQTVVIDGKRHSAYGTACRQPDGTWKIVR